MIENVVAFASLGFAVLFTLLWIWRPEVRAWLEKPKYGFQKNVESYDEALRNRNG